MRRSKRQKSQKMDFHEFGDSCAQNKTSEIPQNALSRFLGLLCAEQDVGNLKRWTSRNSGTPVRRTTSEISKNVLSDPTRSPRYLKLPPKCTQEVTKSGQGPEKCAQSYAKGVPRTCQDLPSRPKSSPRIPRGTEKSSKMVPRAPQETPKKQKVKNARGSSENPSQR